MLQNYTFLELRTRICGIDYPYFCRSRAFPISVPVPRTLEGISDSKGLVRRINVKRITKCVVSVGKSSVVSVGKPRQERTKNIGCCTGLNPCSIRLSFHAVPCGAGHSECGLCGTMPYYALRARIFPVSLAQRRRMTPKRASLKMPPDILLVPSSRLTKTTGTSLIRYPSVRAVNFISIWKA